MEKAFIDMVNEHRGIIYKVCNLYVQEPEHKKDLFQEIILQLWKAFPSYRGQAQRSTWMYRIALNTAISNFRKESRKPDERPLSAQELQIPEAYTYADENENIQWLMKAIDQLNPIEKAIIMLHLDEKSYDEITNIMGISKSNVGVKLNRIKTKLETFLKQIQ